MSLTAFPTMLNNFAPSALGANYTLGAGAITLATGDGTRLANLLTALSKPAISTTHRMRFTVGTSASLNFVFEATALVGDVLSGAVVENSDHAFPTGTPVNNFFTAGQLDKITGAVNAAETITNGVTKVRTSAPPNGMTTPTGGLVNLALGSSDETSGIANQATALQAIHDLNAGGGWLEVYYDNAYPADGVKVNSRSRTTGAPGAGLKRITGITPKPLISNATLTAGVVTIDNNPSTGGGFATIGNFGNTDIAIDSLTLNGNAGNVSSPPVGSQGENRTVGLQLWGVQRLKVDGVTVYDQGRFGVWLKNIRDAHFTRGVVEVPTTSATPDSRDGLDLSLCDDFHLKGWRIKANDDAIFVGGNGGGNGSITDAGALHAGPLYYAGPSGLVTISDIDLDASCRGIDVCSTDQAIGTLFISNIKGSVYDYPLHFWAFNPTGTRAGSGKIGDVLIVGWNVTALGSVQTDGWCALGANFRSLTVKGLRHSPDANNLFPYFQVASGVAYNLLKIEYDADDLDVSNRARQVVLDAGTGDAFVGDINISRPGLTAVSYPAYKKTGGGINSVLVNGRMDRVSHMVEIVSSTTIPTIQLRGLHSNAGGGGSLNVGSGQTVTNLGHGGLLSVLASDGSGTISHDIGAGTYTEPSATLLSSLVWLGKLGEASGATRVDSVGGVNLAESGGSVSTGTLFGQTVAAFAGAGTTTFQPVLTHANNAVFQPAAGQQFWVACEFSVTTLPATAGRLVTFADPSLSKNVFVLGVLAAGTVRFAVYDATGGGTTGTNLQLASWGTNLSTGGAHKVVAGYDGSNVWISVDNGAKVTVATAVATGQLGTASFSVGGYPDGHEAFNGTIGRVAFGKGYTPSTGDIATIWNSGADYTFGL